MSVDVLIVDHSRYGSAALKSFLSLHGFTVFVSTYKEFERKITQKKFDLLVTESTLNVNEIKDVSQLLRCSQTDAFFMALLKNSTAVDRVSVLEAGADDCMDVPYHPQELLMRLGKLVERKHSTRTGLIATKDFELDVHSGDLHCPWGKTSLRKKEFLIFSLLLQQKNHIVPKERLVERIWGMEETPLISTIDVHVRRIRQKIRDYDKKIIQTSYGVGYMFCEQ